MVATMFAQIAIPEASAEAISRYQSSKNSSSAIDCSIKPAHPITRLSFA